MTVATLTHKQAKRKNIPTAEHQAVLKEEEQNPVRVAYERRNRDLDPQLVWLYARLSLLASRIFHASLQKVHVALLSFHQPQRTHSSIGGPGGG